MSNEAISWSFSLKLPSTSKFVLVALADYANDEWLVYPSIETLINKTSLNKKTIHKSIDFLMKIGILSDTGERKGKTGVIKVYRVNNGIVPNLEQTQFYPSNRSNFGQQVGPNLGNKESQIWNTEPLSKPLEEPLVGTVSGSVQKAPSPPHPQYEFLTSENWNHLLKNQLVPLGQDFKVPFEWGDDMEKLGWQCGEIINEGEKFRQYYVSGKEAGKRRTARGWRQSYSNWMSNAQKWRR